MPKYEFRVSTGYVGCKRTEIVEIDEDDLTGKTEEEIEEYVEKEWAQWVWENIDGGFSRMEDFQGWRMRATETQRCERCKGYGMISSYSFGEMADLGQDCPDCGGDGFIEVEDEDER